MQDGAPPVVQAMIQIVIWRRRTIDSFMSASAGATSLIALLLCRQRQARLPGRPGDPQGFNGEALKTAS